MIDLDTVSRILQIPKSTLRYWESEGLISSVRGDNNYRFYNERDVIEVGDVSLYRKLGVGVRRIPELRRMGNAEAQAFFERSATDIDKKIAELEATKGIIAARLELFERYRALQSEGLVIVGGKELGADRGIVRFDVNGEQSVACWLAHPHDGRYVLVYDDLDSREPYDGWILEGDELSSEVLLEVPSSDARYLRGLLMCDAFDIDDNNLPEFRRYVVGHGLASRRMIARYLMNGYDEDRAREVAYYELFIELT